MEKRNVVAIIVDKRSDVSVTLQKLFTGWGCMIKTRLGIHEGILDHCTQTGLIILEMVGELKKIKEFVRKLNLINGVKANYLSLELPKPKKTKSEKNEL